MAKVEPSSYVFSRTSLDASARRELKIRYLVDLIAERSKSSEALVPTALVPATRSRTSFRDHGYEISNLPANRGLVASMGRFANAIMIAMACIGLASSVIFVGSLFSPNTVTTKAASEAGNTTSLAIGEAAQTSSSAKTPRLSPTSVAQKSTTAPVALPPAAEGNTVVEPNASKQAELGATFREPAAELAETPTLVPQPTPATATARPIPQESSSEPPGAPHRIHVVQWGENLFRIALRYGTSVQAIAIANGIPDSSIIYAGQRLIIP
ncbi:MAG: LysM peptidoglycan-binding domain-containing protein [Chloroflexota bacterium]